MANVTEIMNRVRKAIRDYDPSYRLKARGWICAKEWREIMPHQIGWLATVRIEKPIGADSIIHLTDKELNYVLHDFIHQEKRGGYVRS